MAKIKISPKGNKVVGFEIRDEMRTRLFQHFNTTEKFMVEQANKLCTYESSCVVILECRDKNDMLVRERFYACDWNRATDCAVAMPVEEFHFTV